MTVEPLRGARPDAWRDLAARSELSTLQALLALSTLMTELSDEHDIVGLLASSVPSLAPCEFEGVYLMDVGWRSPTTTPERQDDLERRLRAIGPAGGVIEVEPRWTQALPLRSLDGHLGYLTVAGDTQPPAAAQFLLQLLAQHSGIAIANARVHARERAKAAKLRTANGKLQNTITALERSTAIHERLTLVSMSGEGQNGIARAVHDLTSLPVAIEDRYGNLRAWAGPMQPDPYPKLDPGEREQLMKRALGSGTPIRDGDRLFVVTRPHSGTLGLIALVDPDGTAGESEAVALEHAATVLTTELARLQAVAETERRLGRDLVEDLLTHGDEEHTRAAAQALGYDLERPHRVLVVTRGGMRSRDDLLFDAVRRAVRDLDLGTMLVARGETVVVLADRDGDWEELHNSVGAEHDGTPCRIGVGGVCTAIGDFRRSHREAELAVRLQDAVGGPERAIVFESLGVFRLLAAVDDPALLQEFVDEWIGVLIDYDARRGTQLVDTMSGYLERGGNYDATAALVGAHRNTLKYRLRRIREISGLDLGDADTLFNLQLATRAWNTLRALRNEEP